MNFLHKPTEAGIKRYFALPPLMEQFFALQVKQPNHLIAWPCCQYVILYKTELSTVRSVLDLSGSPLA